MRHYCKRCGRYREFFDVLPKANEMTSALSAMLIPALLWTGRTFICRARCTACLAVKPFRYTERLLKFRPPERSIMDAYLSPFDDVQVEQTNKDKDKYYGYSQDKDTAWSVRGSELRKSGYNLDLVDGDFQYVGKLPPKNPIEGCFAYLIYSIGLPLSYWHWQRKRKENPNAKFYPHDMSRAGRVIIGSDSALLYSHERFGDLNACSFSFEAVRQIRQRRAEICIEFNDIERPTLAIWAGDALGEVLAAFDTLTPMKVLDPNPNWSG